MTNRGLNQPLSGNSAPRFSGPATFMRLPEGKEFDQADVAIVGVPLDIGTSNRPGARLAPREIRDESRLLRPYNMATRAAPFDSMQVADFGDVPINTFNLNASVEIIEHYFATLFEHDCIPLTLGGDHTIALPILRAACKRFGPVALVHVDAHADSNEEMFGEKITHGTPFRRAVEENLLLNEKVYQIGLRGSGYHHDDFDWGRKQGFHLVEAHECWHRSLGPLMVDVREQIADAPTYISFDIDGLDPSFAPGTGTPEPAGLTASQGFEIVRGCRGLNIVGGDLVEVSPPFDLSRNTSLLGANIIFEMMCVLPKSIYRN